MKKQIQFLLMLPFLTSVRPAFAQVAQVYDNLGFVEIKTENDFYYLRLPSDRYFTSGKTLLIQSPSFQSWNRFYPLQMKRQASHNEFSLQLDHQLFTPFRIEWNNVNQLDRPYAAMIFASFNNQSTLSDEQSTFTKKIRLGWVGPSVQGEALQNWFHRLKGRPLARAWDYQIKNQLLLGLNLQFSKVFLNTTDGLNLQHRLAYEPELELNTLQQQLGLKLNYVLGDLEQWDKRDGQLSWYIYFNLGPRLVYDNQLITGELAPSANDEQLELTSLHNILFIGEYGIWLRWRSWDLQLTQNALSPEYKGGSAHFWGGISLRRYFE